MDTNQYNKLVQKIEDLNDTMQDHIKTDAEIHKSITELTAFLGNLKTGLRVLAFLSVLGKWMAGVAIGLVAAAGLISWIKTGTPPNISAD